MTSGDREQAREREEAVEEVSGGIADYKRPKNKVGHAGWWTRRRCRRNGGHWEGEAYVTGYIGYRRFVELSHVCTECGAYLGPIKAEPSPRSRLDIPPVPTIPDPSRLGG